jgi:hypothetical protein
MRRILAAGLGLLAAMSLGRANAQEMSACPKTGDVLPAPRTVVVSEERTPLATLGRPVAISRPLPPALTDRQVKTASFSLSEALIGAPRPLARVQSSEAPQPLPVGPISDDFPGTDSPALQKDTTTPSEQLGPPRLVPIPKANGMPAVPGGIVDNGVCAPGCDGDVCDGSCEDGVCPGGCGLFRRWGAATPDGSRFWFRGEYLLWWFKDGQMPPLVTTSPPGTPRDMAGVLGAPGTSILFPGDAVSSPDHSGGRFTFGFWFDPDQLIGLESTSLFLGARTYGFLSGSGGLPILARPFFNVGTGMEASELVAYPGVLAGNIAVTSTSQLWGTELNLRTNCWQGCFWHVDWLAGVRFVGLDENLSIAEGLTVPAGTGSLAGSGILVQDSFSTHNLFVGGQTGVDIGWRRGPWSMDLLAKVALGNTHEEANISGYSQFTVPGLPASVQQGGLYALPSNIGHFSQNRFTVVPEAGITVGYQLTPRWRALISYSFLYSSSVLRPGQQIDRGINITQLPSQVGPGTLVGAARPAPILQSSDFWAQGISLGLELRY